VARCASSLFGAPALEGQIADSPEVGQFLNEVSCKTLQIITDGQGLKLLAKKTALPPEGMLECHFIKTSDEPLTAQNVSSNVLVASIRGGPAFALYS